MIVPDHSDNYRSAQRTDSRTFKFQKNSRKKLNIIQKKIPWLHVDPGSTQKKRKPDVVASGQIQKPGGDGSVGGAADAIIDSPLESRKKPKAARSLLFPAPSTAKEVSSDAASEDLPSEDDDAGGIAGPSGIAAPKKMPAEVESSSNFNRLVNKCCARPWLTVPALEAAVPTQHWHQLYLATSWSARARSDYDKMIANQMQGGDGCISRREDPTNVACVHRPRLAYTCKAGLALTGELLALIVVTEKPSDFSGKAGPRLGGAWQRAGGTKLSGSKRTYARRRSPSLPLKIPDLLRLFTIASRRSRIRARAGWRFRVLPWTDCRP
jgi:hypothetical protein